jgi:NAD(P)-dependent dehydrogenase (short-subunit alcohol dehydrogenase family)
VPVDLANPNATQTVLDALGNNPKLDVLVNCAGISRPDAPTSDRTPIVELQASMSASDPDAWTQTFLTNVQAPYALSVGLLHLLAVSPSNGRIINISSIGAIMTDPNVHQPAYQTSKAALDHLTRILASKFRQHGVRVNGIAPGYFPSAMNDPNNPKSMVARSEELVPVKRAGKEEDIAGTAIWLASPAGSYVNGQVIAVDGGRSWAWVQMG